MVALSSAVGHALKLQHLHRQPIFVIYILFTNVALSSLVRAADLYSDIVVDFKHSVEACPTEALLEIR